MYYTQPLPLSLNGVYENGWFSRGMAHQNCLFGYQSKAYPVILKTHCVPSLYPSNGEEEATSRMVEKGHAVSMAFISSFRTF
ncbi:MAG: hypothetical protein JSV24_10135, partial [Bacteroidales bacterium]